MAELTKEQTDYINTLFSVYCKKINRDMTDGDIFKLCRNYFDELKKNKIEYDETYKCYLMMKEFRDKK